MREMIIKFIKFGIVGFINTMTSTCIYWFLITIKLNYILSTTIAYFIASLIGYTLNKNKVFKTKNDNSIIKYYIVYISSYFLNIGCMYIFVDILKISAYIAPLLTLFVTVPYNFMLSNFWVFRKEKSKKLDSSIHTFAICAYKESEHLEACIESIMNQTVKTNTFISTSTPNKYIYDLARKYNLEVYETGSKSDIQDDWNFAYNKANTKLVTVAHQDDIYESNYTEEILKKYNNTKNINIIITDYIPLKNNKKSKDLNFKIKKIMKTCLRSNFLAKFKFFKVLSLSMGNSICCPSVTYNKEKLGNTIFTSNLKFSLDWDTFLKIARMNGRIAYIPKYLINYRVYDGATTKEFIINNTRQIEDVEMFSKIWPKSIVKIIMKFYVKAYDTYK